LLRAIVPVQPEADNVFKGLKDVLLRGMIGRKTLKKKGMEAQVIKDHQGKREANVRAITRKVSCAQQGAKRGGGTHVKTIKKKHAWKHKE